MRLGGRGARRMVFAKLLKQENGFGRRRQTRERKRGLENELSCGDGNGDMANLANLAMLLVEGLFMPVNDGMQAQSAHH